MTEPNRPASLRAFLDAGGDVTTLERWESLVEEAVDALVSAPHYRAQKARTNRYYADEIRQGKRFGIPRTDGSLRPFTLLDAHDWERDAEVLEDPALARRLIDSLSEPARAAALSDLDHTRRAHPLTVAVPEKGAMAPSAEDGWGEQWHCYNCGEAHDVGDGVAAAVIGYRPGWSRLDYPITYCAGCIELAAQALKPAPASL